MEYKEMPVRSVAGPDDSQRPASAEAILAGTLGLMTAHAQAAANDQRRRIAQVVEDNLAGLSEHPALSFHFRQSLSALRLHWQLLQLEYRSSPEGEDLSFSQAESPRTH